MKPKFPSSKKWAKLLNKEEAMKKSWMGHILCRIGWHYWISSPHDASFTAYCFRCEAVQLRDDYWY